MGEAAALAILGRSPSHPNVMPLIDSFADAASDSLYLVMPHADGGELFALAAESGTGLPEEEARKYLTQIVAGLLHLKSHGLAHGYVIGWVRGWDGVYGRIGVEEEGGRGLTHLTD